MSFRDRNRNYAASQREPLAYWLACVLGIILGLAAFALLLFAIARNLAGDL
jgi:hypothetical protein